MNPHFNEAPQQLHQRALQAAQNLKTSEINLLGVLSEIDSAKAYLDLGYNSLFAYSVSALGLSEAQAYSFMAIARKSKSVPILKQAVEAGRLSVSKAAKIVSVVKVETANEWIQKAVSLPRSQLEGLVAAASGRPVTDRELIRPMSADSSRIHLSISKESLEDLKRAQVLASQGAEGAHNLEATLSKVLKFYLKHKDPIQRAERAKQNEMSNQQFPGRVTPRYSQSQSVNRRPHLPAHTKHNVFQRDRGICQALNATTGEICGSSWFIELHHKTPISMGGGHQIENLTSLCSQHHRRGHEIIRS